LLAGKDIIGGMYPMNGAGTSTAGWFQDDGNHRINYPYFKDLEEPFEVDYVGFGFLLMRRGVLEEIGYPWFQPEMVEFLDKETAVHSSEDVAFCRKAQRAGFAVHVHPRVHLDHQKPVTLTFGKSGVEVKDPEGKDSDGATTAQ
jgi:GT2 family glycosyltransferase